MSVIEKIKGTEYGKRTIGYLDLLGVSQKILNCPLTEVAQIYLETNIYEKASHLFVGGEELAGTVRPVKYIQFSDSALFYGGADSPAELRLMVNIISGLMTTLLLNSKVCSRGAISVGDFIVNEEFRIYAGRPLLEAVKVEAIMDCMGLVLIKPPDESLLEELHKYRLISDLKIPFKDSSKITIEKLNITRDRLVPINWFKGEEGASKIKEILCVLGENMKNTTGEEAQKKIKNTIDFIGKSTHL